jgi:hypothetical protein
MNERRQSMPLSKYVSFSTYAKRPPNFKKNTDKANLEKSQDIIDVNIIDVDQQ